MAGTLMVESPPRDAWAATFGAVAASVLDANSAAAGSLTAVVRGMHELLDGLDPGRPLPAGTDLGATLAEVDRLAARVQAVRMTVVATADCQGVAAEAAHTGTDAWVAARTRQDTAQAARDVKLAARLQSDLPATRDALAAGRLSADHAHVIAASTAVLPAGTTEGQRATIEAALVEEARYADPRRLRAIGRRAVEALGTTVDDVAAHEDAVLRSEEEAARAKCRLTMHDNGDGTTTGRFTVPTLAASVLRKAVQQLSSPRRQRSQSGSAGATESTDWAHEHGASLVELLEHLPTDRLSGKVAATVVVTLDLETMRRGLGAAHLDTGDTISASEARRLACSAGIVPAVLDGPSLPLDLGRTERFFTEAQRVALATKYDSCAAFGCGRPYSWCELHHEEPWSEGGPTDLALAVPLCGHHHRRAHDPAYHHRLITDAASGHKTVGYSLRR